MPAIILKKIGEVMPIHLGMDYKLLQENLKVEFTSQPIIQKGLPKKHL